MACQARAQARTAIQFLDKHPHWRVALATGQIGPALWWSGVVRSIGWPQLLDAIATGNGDGRALPMDVRRWAAARYARAEYYAELVRARTPAITTP